MNRLHLASCLIVVMLGACAGGENEDREEWRKMPVDFQYARAKTLIGRCHADSIVDEDLEFMLSVEPSLSQATNAVHETLLHEVAKVGHVGHAEILLDAGGGVDRLDKRGRTAFHIAAIENQVPMLELFLHRGASINSWGPIPEMALKAEFRSEMSMGSPLDLAAQNGAADSVAYLLAAGAKIDSAPEGIRFTALHHAMCGRWINNAQLNRKWHDERVLFPENRYPGEPPSRGNSVVIQLLMEHGADPRAKDNDGQEPIHIAAKHCDYDAIDFFLKHYHGLVDVNAVDRFGNTPLMVATRNAVRDPMRSKQTLDVLRRYGGL